MFGLSLVEAKLILQHFKSHSICKDGGYKVGKPSKYGYNVRFFRALKV